MNISIIAILFLLLFPSVGYSDVDFIETTAEGVGSSLTQALTNAWENALLSAVTSSTKEVTSEKRILIQENFSRSNSFVIISETKEKGSWKVKITAHVFKDIIEKYHKRSADLTDNIISIINDQEKREEAIKTIRSFIIPYDLQNFIDYDFEIRIINNKLTGLHTLTLNRDKYGTILLPEFNMLFKNFAENVSEEFYDKHTVNLNHKYESLIHNKSIEYKIPQSLDDSMTNPLGMDKSYDLTNDNNSISIYSGTSEYKKYSIPTEIINESIVKFSRKFELTCFVEIGSSGKIKRHISKKFPCTLFFKPDVNEFGPFINGNRQIRIYQFLNVKHSDLNRVTNITGGYQLR